MEEGAEEEGEEEGGGEEGYMRRVAERQTDDQRVDFGIRMTLLLERLEYREPLTARVSIC